MNVGTENKKKTLAAAVLGALALILLFWLLLPSLFGGDSTPLPTQPSTAKIAKNTPPPQQQRSNRASPNRTRPQGTRGLPVINTLDPTIRLDLLDSAEGQHYKGSGRNIFETYVPPPPPINLKFYGWASKPGEPKRVFLSQGDRIFVASEGQLVANRYKVVKINNGNVQIEDILNSNTQSIPMS
jgi:hypothetical protein